MLNKISSKSNIKIVEKDKMYNPNTHIEDHVRVLLFTEGPGWLNELGRCRVRVAQ